MKDKIIVKKDNKLIEYELLFTVKDEKNGTNYVVYTDNTKDGKGLARVYISRQEKNELVDVSSEERKQLEKIVSVVQNEVTKK